MPAIHHHNYHPCTSPFITIRTRSPNRCKQAGKKMERDGAISSWEMEVGYWSVTQRSPCCGAGDGGCWAKGPEPTLSGGERKCTWAFHRVERRTPTSYLHHWLSLVPRDQHNLCFDRLELPRILLSLFTYLPFFALCLHVLFDSYSPLPRFTQEFWSGLARPRPWVSISPVVGK